MKWTTYFVALLLFLACWMQGAYGALCNFCLATTEPTDCLIQINCSEGIGCFSRSWVNEGKRYYDKGCQTPSVTSCPAFTEYFCTYENAIQCCNTDRCNSVDLLSIWKPLHPRNVVISYPSANTLALQWDVQCNGVYNYQVTYKKKGENSVFLGNINENKVEIPNISAGLYEFSVVSVYGNRFSAAALIERQITEDDISRYLYCAVSSNVTLDDFTSIKVEQCTADQQRCYAILSYPTEGSQSYISRGCTTSETCEVAKTFPVECRPGTAKTFCTFCCEGSGCNENNNVILSNLTCEGINQSSRIDCGWQGIDPVTCQSRGCCYRETDSVAYDKWCYHKRLSNDPLATTSSNDVLIGGLSTWLIIVIVFAVILLILIIAIIVYCVRARRRKNKKGFYNVDPIYATPSSLRSGVRTVSRSGIDNSGVSVESPA